tara:strand:+ start:331 stop:954 length:624 start_codon:yes stop_codon:yes gene_type:complete
MKQQRKEFIIQAHAAACSDWKAKIEKEFPKLFKKDQLIVGKWYKYDDNTANALIVWNDSKDTYGFWSGEYSENLSFFIEGDKVPATDKEVSKALIQEANKRGYKNGNYKCLSSYPTIDKVKDGFYFEFGSLWMGEYNSFINKVFENGVWAEIIEEEKPVYEWQYIYNCPFDGCSKSTGYYTSKKEFKRLVVTLPPIKKVKESKRIRK